MSPIAQTYDPTGRFELTPLRYVSTIAALGSMSQAARQLKVSQPTLSNAVRGLETKLNTTLFLRGPRGVIPTAAGRLLAQTADGVLTLLREGDERLREVETRPSGRFMIGYHASFGALFLPALVDDLLRGAPGLEVTLWEGIGPKVIDAVVDRTVHFGVDTTSGAPVRPHPELVTVPLFRDVFCVIRAPNVHHPDTLFHVPRIPPSAKLLETLDKRRTLPSRVVSCGDLELVKALVLRGAGLGILPWRVAIRGGAKGALKLADPSLPHEIDTGCLFYRADLHRTRAALLLKDELVRQGRLLERVPLPHGVAPLRASVSREAAAPASRAPRAPW